MTNQEYATTEALASIGIIIAQNAKAADAWGWSIQNDKIIRDWEGPYATPAHASAAALAWLMEYARKGLLCHHIHTEPLAPDLQLVHCRGTEGVRGAEKQGLSLGLEALTQFGNGGRLARTIDANDHDHGRFFLPPWW